MIQIQIDEMRKNGWQELLCNYKPVEKMETGDSGQSILKADKGITLPNWYIHGDGC